MLYLLPLEKCSGPLGIKITAHSAVLPSSEYTWYEGRSRRLHDHTMPLGPFASRRYRRKPSGTSPDERLHIEMYQWSITDSGLLDPVPYEGYIALSPFLYIGFGIASCEKGGGELTVSVCTFLQGTCRRPPVCQFRRSGSAVINHRQLFLVTM